MNLEIRRQVYSAARYDDDRRREEEKQQEWEEERVKKALGRLEKEKSMNGKKKCASRKRAEEKRLLMSPAVLDVFYEEEKEQEREEERVKKALGRLGMENNRNWKKKCGSRTIAGKKLLEPEVKAKIDQIGRLPVGQGYMRGRRGDRIYIRRTKGPGCWWTGDSPPKTVGCSLSHGANFLSKTIRITPDGSDSTLDRYCTDETKIVVKGKDSVCVVARCSHQDCLLGGVAYGSAVLFCIGEKDGRRLESADLMPFSHVTFSLDTEKEGCGEYIESEGFEDSLLEDYEPLRDEGLAAHFNEQKAVNYLENKMKQDPVISHQETIQTAITAFRYLLPEGFRSDEIKVHVVGRGLWINSALSVEEVEEHLGKIVN